MRRKLIARLRPFKQAKIRENTLHPHSAGEELIRTLCGCCKGEDSLVDSLHKQRQEKTFAERRWGES